MKASLFIGGGLLAAGLGFRIAEMETPLLWTAGLYYFAFIPAVVLAGAWRFYRAVMPLVRRERIRRRNLAH